MIIFLSTVFAIFSTPHHIFPISPPPQHFPTPQGPQFFSTYPILPQLVRVLYSARAVTYCLSGCMNVLCNWPIPACPPAPLPATRFALRSAQSSFKPLPLRRIGGDSHKMLRESSGDHRRFSLLTIFFHFRVS